MVSSDVPGLFVCNLSLTRPLAAGETAVLEFRTHFAYATAPAPEFRCGSRGPLHNLDIEVRFDPTSAPASVAWGAWDLLDDHEPTVREPVALAPDCSVHRFVDVLENRLVGFLWEWPGARTPADAFGSNTSKARSRA